MDIVYAYSSRFINSSDNLYLGFYLDIDQQGYGTSNVCTKSYVDPSIVRDF